MLSTSQNILEHCQLQQTAIERQIKQVAFLNLFRFAKTKDIIFMVIGSMCSILIGGALPFLSYLWGNMTNSFQNSQKMVQEALKIFIEYMITGVLSILAGWGMQYFWMAAGEGQANECRKSYLEALMRQEIGWFETQQATEIVSRFVADCQSFQQAIGEKISLIIYLLSMFISGCIIALISGWEMALVVLAFQPLIIFSFWMVIYFEKRRSQNEEEIFQSASGIAQEAIQSIKVVKQFNGQDHEISRFQTKINEVKSQSFWFNVKMTLGQSLCLFFLSFSFVLAYWYGFECISSTSRCPQKSPNPYNAGSVLSIFFCLLLPAMNLNQFTPTFKSIAEGKMAAARIFSVIDRDPTIKSGAGKIKLENLKGVFRFEGVSFAYPKDKSKMVLRDLDLEINCRHTGIMGQSGCGKSTLLQLMMRFYDPDEGVITLDGVDLKELDLQWLRQQIGYIGQEPLLFSATIKENLQIGKSDATEEELIEALRCAQLLEFVMELSQTVDTYVGSGGSQLSGGQKQRVAIARALLKNPSILLLDQATSALDRTNEKNIQQTLNAISSQKISITVAHRLRTIMNSDQFIVLQKGKVKQHGKLCEIQSYQRQRQMIQSDIVESMKSLQFSPSKRSAQRFSTLKSLQSLKKISHISAFESKQFMPNDIAPNQIEEVKQQQQKIDVYRSILEYTKGKRLMIAIGILSSLVTGAVLPTMGLHVARILSFELMYHFDQEYYRSQIRWEYFYMLITCAVAPFAVGMQYHTFLNVGCSIVNKMRQEIYRKVIKLPLAWFQNKENHAELTSLRLGADMYTINHIISKYLPHFCAAFSNVVISLLLAFIFQWRIALVSIVLIPLMGLVGVIQGLMISGYLEESQNLYEQSAKMLAQVIINMKTIISYCYEKQAISKYQRKLEEIQRQQFRKKFISAFLCGFTYFILFAVFGTIFLLSAIFIRDNNISITNSFSAVFLILVGGSIAGNNIKQIPDLGKLKPTAAKLFALMSLQDQDQIQRKKGSKMINTEIEGNLSFKDVGLRYESREEFALRNTNFDVKAGEKVNFVGSSGCGKSTLLKLLLGFYFCQQGQIKVDSIPIQDYNVHCLRQHFGTVSQEPELFDDTIEYNIAYNLTNVTKQQIYAAARKAKLIPSSTVNSSQQCLQIEQFFKRKVGPRGSHLSGGQKQRVAIARTILRNPKIILLDEATSALDKENEAQVQQSIEAVMEGRTTLNVTHKLQQLSSSPKIFVMEAGAVVEQGSYDQLIVKNGSFFRLLHGLQNDQ